MNNIYDDNFKYSDDYKDLNPLVFSSIHNIIDDDKFLTTLNGKLKYNEFGDSSTDSKLLALDDILSESTIKKGCCMYEKGTGDKSDMIQTTVKIPVPETINSSPDDYGMNTGDAGWLAKEFGFYNKTVFFPEELCPKEYLNEDKKGTDSCDDFFTVYCANQKQDLDNKYDKDNTRVRQTEYINFSPECACYGDMSAYEEAGIQSSPVCLLEGCSVANKIYLDPVSRQNGGVCDASFCMSSINLTDASVGQNMDINYVNNQQCGNYQREQAKNEVLSNDDSDDDDFSSGSSSGTNGSGSSSGTNDSGSSSGTNGSSSDSGSNSGTNGSGSNSGTNDSGSSSGTNGSGTNSSGTSGSSDNSSLWEKIWGNTTYRYIFIGTSIFLFFLLLLIIFKSSGSKSSDDSEKEFEKEEFEDSNEFESLGEYADYNY